MSSGIVYDNVPLAWSIYSSFVTIFTESFSKAERVVPFPAIYPDFFLLASKLCQHGPNISRYSVGMQQHGNHLSQRNVAQAMLVNSCKSVGKLRKGAHDHPPDSIPGRR